MKGQRYHIRYRDARSKKWGDWGVTAEGRSPRLDQDIAAALAGQVVENSYFDKADAEECTELRCALCAGVGLSLDVVRERGDMVIETYGEYSNYGVGSLFKVLKRFPPEKFKSTAEAVAAGYMIEVPYREWWNGER